MLTGTFVLLSLVGLFLFAIWLARSEVRQQFALYQIYLQGSVAGLGIGGDVRYRGIKIGSIASIAIDSDDPSQVKVIIQIDPSIPIRVGDEASLQVQGITGIAYLNIEGATATSPPLEAAKEDELPIIPSKPSGIEQLVQSAPELLNRGILLMDQLAKLFNEENQQLLRALLLDIQTITHSFSEQMTLLRPFVETLGHSGEEFAALIKTTRTLAARANRFVEQGNQTLVRANTALARADTLMQKDMRGLIAEAEYNLQSIGRLADKAQAILAENREPLRNFSREGLNEWYRLLGEFRLLVAGLTRLTDQMESGGLRSLVGTGSKDVEVSPP